jgi:hypothetical protein
MFMKFHEISSFEISPLHEISWNSVSTGNPLLIRPDHRACEVLVSHLWFRGVWPTRVQKPSRDGCPLLWPLGQIPAHIRPSKSLSVWNRYLMVCHDHTPTPHRKYVTLIRGTDLVISIVSQYVQKERDVFPVAYPLSRTYE